MTPTVSAQHETLLTSLTGLMSRWSSLELQRRITAECGVTLDPVAVSALYTLGIMGGSSRPSALADGLHLSRPSTSKLIARLEDAGLISRTAHSSDRRSVSVALTERGAETYRRLVQAGITMVAGATAAWTPSEVTALSSLMQRFLGDISAELTPSTQ